MSVHSYVIIRKGKIIQCKTEKKKITRKIYQFKLKRYKNTFSTCFDACNSKKNKNKQTKILYNYYNQQKSKNIKNIRISYSCAHRTTTKKKHFFRFQSFSRCLNIGHHLLLFTLFFLHINSERLIRFCFSIFLTV